MIVDVITFNGEYDLWDLRYNILKDYVDEFVVCEAEETFSGRKKPLYFERVLEKYEKVRYNVLKPDEELFDLARKSPNTEYGKGAEHWVREWAQKEAIKDAIRCDDEDLVFVGDCDEIWNPAHLTKLAFPGYPAKLRLEVYAYSLNNLSSEQFWGTLVARYKWIKKECLNHLRTNASKTESVYGWHFTSMKKQLRQKLLDSYTKDTYANDWVMDNLDKNIEQNRDFLGRKFTYTKDESRWPQYLKENKEKYLHLL